MLRELTDQDSPAVIRLVARCYGEYADQGVVFDLEEERDLKAVATSFSSGGGRIWGHFKEGGLAATVGYKVVGEDELELFKLYVCPDHRKGGLGRQLVDRILQEAQERAAKSIVLWTDTRFTKAHSLYEKLGFIRQPGSRALGDKSNTVEYCYRKELVRN